MAWWTFLGSAFSIIDKIIDKLPLQNRREWLQNKIDKLEVERSEILIHKADIVKARRLATVNRELEFLRKRLHNLTIK